MGSKRSRPQDDGEPDTTLPHQERSRPKKRPRQNGPETPHPSTAVNHLKRKIRDVTRTLERSEHMPADIRVEKERALAGYRQDLENSEYEKRKQTMIKKYHMVRFFERRKATRRLKRLKALLSKADREGKEYVDLKRKTHEAEVDLNYTLYCPLAEKYASLYKGKADAGDGDVTLSNDSLISQESGAMAPRPAMWDTVEQCMKEEGTLWALRDRRAGKSPASGADMSQPAAVRKDGSQSKKKSQPRKSGKQAIDPVVEGHEDASDDGFFEE